MVFLSTGDSHHDLALVQGGSDGSRGPIGLHHFAFKIGDTLDELVAAKADLDTRNVTVHAAFDFRVSKALILSDPDGNTVELYVDMHPEEWREEPSAVANAAPLNL
jgi:catechol 2,3-dioxygenase